MSRPCVSSLRFGFDCPYRAPCRCVRSGRSVIAAKFQENDAAGKKTVERASNARRRLQESGMPEATALAASETFMSFAQADAMLATISRQLAEVASKEDFAKLEGKVSANISKLEADISKLEADISKLEADISKLPTKQDLQKGPDWIMMGLSAGLGVLGTLAMKAITDGSK